MEPNHHIEILLIEDNPDDADLVKRVLQKNNYDKYLLHVNNGEEALHYLFSDDSHFPVLIIADLKMPLVNGFEFLKKIKSDPKRKMIPVVVLTSSQEDKDILDAYRLGVNAFIVKPMDFNVFSDAILQIARFWIDLNQPPLV